MQKKEIRDVILKYVLQNAVKFKGKANEKAVIGKILSSNPELKSEIAKINLQIKKVVKEVNSQPLEKQIKKLEKIAPELLEEKKIEKKHELALKNVGEKVVMRFAPSPSGPLHIGHAYVLSLNSEYCKKYNGELIVRVEDTNPGNIYAPSYEMIEQDAKWLTKNNVKKFVIQSERLGIYYDYAEKLIVMGKAYVCNCNTDKFRELITKKKTCPCRELPRKEQLLRFDKMFGEYEEGQAVVRVKTDIAHKNPAMRDWAALRINEHEHPKTGTKHRVWPLMNFAVAIDDYELGVTHTIRAKDHMDNEKKQSYIYKYFNWKKPEHLYIGRINFKDLKVSCSEVRKLIEYGKYTGWDDIRLPFLVALKRRGYQRDAFIHYALDVGVSQNDKTVSGDEFFKAINAFNKDAIDKSSNRYFFIWDPIRIEIKDAPKIDVKINLHPDFPKRGKREFKTSNDFYITKEDFKELKEEKLYRLMDCLNFIKEDDKLIFNSLDYEKFKDKGHKIIHWLPIDKLINVEILMPDASIKKGLAEPTVKDLRIGDIVQFERFGFCRLDKKEKNKLIFWYGHK